MPTIANDQYFTCVLQDFQHRREARGVASIRDVGVAYSTPAPSGETRADQIVLPYAGVFGYRVGSRHTLFDANSILFATAGDEFSDNHVVPGVGHASLILEPAQCTLEDVIPSKADIRAVFRQGSVPASGRAQLLTHRLRGALASGETLETDELTVALVGEVAGARPVRSAPRVVALAKAYLHACADRRLSLIEVARAVGVTPTYLSNTFTVAEGRPLYRYQTDLRLSRALGALPQCKNITTLALDLGFSSHAHFTAAFTATYGLSPSAFRAERC